MWPFIDKTHKLELISENESAEIEIQHSYGKFKINKKDILDVQLKSDLFSYVKIKSELFKIVDNQSVTFSFPFALISYFLLNLFCFRCGLTQFEAANFEYRDLQYLFFHFYDGDNAFLLFLFVILSSIVLFVILLLCFSILFDILFILLLYSNVNLRKINFQKDLLEISTSGKTFHFRVKKELIDINQIFGLKEDTNEIKGRIDWYLFLLLLLTPYIIPLIIGLLKIYQYSGDIDQIIISLNASNIFKKSQSFFEIINLLIIGFGLFLSVLLIIIMFILLIISITAIGIWMSLLGIWIVHVFSVDWFNRKYYSEIERIPFKSMFYYPILLFFAFWNLLEDFKIFLNCLQLFFPPLYFLRNFEFKFKKILVSTLIIIFPITGIIFLNQFLNDLMYIPILKLFLPIKEKMYIIGISLFQIEKTIYFGTIFFILNLGFLLIIPKKMIDRLK